MYYVFFVLLTIILDGEHLSFGGGKVLEMLGLVVMFAGCIRYLPIRYSRFYFLPTLNIYGFLLYILFLMIMIVSFWRTSSFVTTHINILKITTLYVFFPLLLYFVFQDNVSKGKSTGKELLILMIHALGIFCFLNLLYIVLNPTFLSGGATVFKIIGISTKKIKFSLYDHVHPNSIGVMGAYLVVLCTGFVMNIKSKEFKENGLFKIYIFLGIIILSIGDSRGTFFSTFLCIIILFFIIKAKSYGLLKLSVLVLPLSHIIFILILQNVADTEVMSSISRNSSELATGNSRKFIYNAANDVLMDVKPIHFIGYGEYGVYAAGITEKYVHKFGELTQRKQLMVSVAHNSALQAILDVGYLGLLIYILLLIIIFHQSEKLIETGHKHFVVIPYFIVFYLITGISESNFGKYWNSSFILFVYLTLVVVLAYNYQCYQNKQKRADS
jgi:hypothetical protein